MLSLEAGKRDEAGEDGGRKEERRLKRRGQGEESSVDGKKLKEDRIRIRES